MRRLFLMAAQRARVRSSLCHVFLTYRDACKKSQRRSSHKGSIPVFLSTLFRRALGQIRAAAFSTRDPNHEISPTTPIALGPRNSRRRMPLMWGTRLVWVLGAADIRDTCYRPYVPG